ncbi:MAG: HDOD domain-containing protein [Burkholderiaceae bacterium]
MHTVDPHREPRAGAGAAPSFGRFQLLRLLGKSSRTLVWAAMDPRSDEECLLVVSRAQAAGAAELEQHLHAARRALRVSHPGLAVPLEIGEHDRWPFAVYARAGAVTLAERASSKGLSAQDAAQTCIQLLDALAFAHEAGLAHRDIQASMVLLGEAAGARLIGLEMAHGAAESATAYGDEALAPAALQAQRSDAQRDVLAVGLVLHYALTGQHPLERNDTAAVIELMPPAGREIVRLPWSNGRTIPEALRVIANRATDRQPRQRYHSARTLARALEGWFHADARTDGGPIPLLLERLRQNGPLPSLPGASRRAARLAMMERERTSELAETVLQDPALAFEMLRLVNTAQARGTMGTGSGPVITVRRAIAMLGLDGVRRAALSLRDWPGPLSEAQAQQMQQAIARAQRAGRIAQLLRPPGYDAEVVNLVALLQNLGRLVARYHFPDETAQVWRLMQPHPSDDAQRAEEPGMSEESAAFAVFGVDIEQMGAAVARHWGLDDSVLHMIHRFSPSAPVRAPETDDDQLRLAASCANEVVDAITLAHGQPVQALQRVAQRYARALGVTLRDLQQVAQGQAPDAGDADADDPVRSPLPGSSEAGTDSARRVA